MKITLSALFIFGIALILTAPNAALAQDNPNYVNIKLGGFFPQTIWKTRISTLDSPGRSRTGDIFSPTWHWRRG